jgi:hypothetical protein
MRSRYVPGASVTWESAEMIGVMIASAVLDSSNACPSLPGEAVAFEP